MDAAKAAVKKFTSHDGHHDTTVHERVNPSITNETVTRQQEDRVTTAIDKEVHQDHYHTSVQPVHDNQVLPEKHHHNLVGVEHRKFDHDDASKVKETLAAEQAKFRDTTERVEGKHTTSAQPVVAGEHVHHHVHENIQPVVNKQTIEPHVVHTTVPIHEVHHNQAQHHATSALPAMSMDEFKTKGGSLTGREERMDNFEGCPTGAHSTSGSHSHSHGTHSHGTHSHGTTGLGGATGATGAHSHNTTGTSGLADTHSRGTTGSSGLTGANDRSTGINSAAGTGVASGTAAGIGSNTLHSSQSGATSGHHHDSTLTGNRNKDLPSSMTNTTSNTSSSTTSSKPSLMDRLNPMKDTNGDGKKGIMS